MTSRYPERKKAGFVRADRDREAHSRTDMGTEVSNLRSTYKIC